MKEKVLIINSCLDCKHFKDEFFGPFDYKLVCELGGSKVEAYMIPDDCPLEDKKEE